MFFLLLFVAAVYHEVYFSLCCFRFLQLLLNLLSAKCNYYYFFFVAELDPEMKIQVTSKSCGSPAVFSMHWRAGTWLWTACERLASRKWFKTPDCITSCRDSFHQLHIGTLHPSALIKWLLTGNNLLHMQHRREINLQMHGCVNMSFFFF